MVMSFCAVLFPTDEILDEILNLIESVSEDFPSYSSTLSWYRPDLICLLLGNSRCHLVFFAVVFR